jgi:putative PIN family toxin of toxin-antitoxin system
VRIVLDTNVLVSALINPRGLPHQLLDRWEAGDVTLVTSVVQREEIGRVLSYDRLRHLIATERAEILLSNLSHVAEVAENLPTIDASRDAADNVIIATAIAGHADYLVTGDKRDLLVLKQVQNVRIVTVREAIDLLQQS